MNISVCLCFQLSISTVKACLELLVTWVHAYIATTADTVTHADVQHHGPFYSVCQAVFYVFIFRHKEILAKKKGQRALWGHSRSGGRGCQRRVMAKRNLHTTEINFKFPHGYA